MKRLLTSILLIGLTISGMVLVFSCSETGEAPSREENTSRAPSGQQERTMKKEGVTDTEDLSPVKSPNDKEALVIFSSGEVESREPDSPEWKPVEIGQKLTSKEMLRVGEASYCELQFGEYAVVKVKESTTLSLARVNLEEKERSVRMEMEMGSVLNKVEKLAKGEDFKVETPTAVCGIRGTQFSVEADGEETTMVAVKEGSVSVQPGSVDAEELRETIQGTGEQQLLQALELIGQTATTVSADQQIDIGKAAAKDAEEALAGLTEAAERFAAEQEKRPGEKELKELLRLSERAARTFAAEETDTKPLSGKKRLELREIEEMRLIAFGETEEKRERTPVTDVHKVAIRVEPGDARIILNGKERGKGSFSGLFEQDEQLSFTIIREGFESRSFEIRASEETSKLYHIRLQEKEQKIQENSLTIHTDPEDARILLGGSRVATGSYSASYEVGETVSFTVKKEGYEERRISLRVQEGAAIEREVVLQKEEEKSSEDAQELIVRTEPGDARILINGTRKGRGEFSRHFESGRELTISARRDGYRSTEVSYTTKDSGKKRLSLELEPLPVQFTVNVASARLIGSAVAYRHLVIVADKNGSLYAVTRDGEKQWEVATENERNENSYPVVIGSTIYFTGAQELVKVNARSGSVISRSALSGDAVHLFGRRVAGSGEAVIMPTNSSLRLLDPSTGERRKSISVPGGSRMTPALWRDMIVTVNQQGTLLVIDPEKETVRKEISTGGMQPVASSPAVREDTAVFSGRRGTVVCADLAEGTVKWEKSLADDSVSVFSDPERSGKGVYIYAEGTIYALAPEDGSQLFSPITGTTGPPLCHEGKLYYGTERGGLSEADARTGKVSGRIESEKIITTRAVMSGERIAAGTKDGTVMVMHP